jgi:shikimate kinase
VERDKIHIFLIGFMGSGKTSLGKLLARKLNFDFLDTDMQIEEQENCSIQEIFNSNGETYFRDLEHQLLNNISQTKNATVFSTGGGMPIFNDNISVMKENGIVVFLNVPVGMLYFRLKNDVKRPLLAEKENLFSYIETTLNERMPIYSQANFVIDARLNKSELVDEIIDFYNRTKFNL